MISWLIHRIWVVVAVTAVQDKVGRDPLVVARAASELAARRRLAAAVAAAEAGRTQRDIAAALEVSQPAVAQMLARARRWPEDWQRTPRQVALEYAAGELAREQLRKELIEWPWTHGHLDGPEGPAGEWPETYVRGSWDQVLDAVREGLVDEADYEYVFTKTR